MPRTNFPKAGTLSPWSQTSNNPDDSCRWRDRRISCHLYLEKTRDTLSNSSQFWGLRLVLDCDLAAPYHSIRTASSTKQAVVNTNSNEGLEQGFLRCFENRVPRIRETYHQVPRIRENRVPRIREIGYLQVRTGYLAFSLKKPWNRVKLFTSNYWHSQNNILVPKRIWSVCFGSQVHPGWH